MRIKSYFSRTIEEAISKARQELGPDAMLVNSRKAAPEARHLGEYEVVFGEPAITSVPDAPARAISEPPASSVSGDRIAAEVAALKRQLESMRRTLTKSVFAPSQWPAASPIVSETYSLLTANGVAADLAQQIVQYAASRTGSAGNGSHSQSLPGEKLWRDAVAEEIRSRVSVEPILGVSPAAGAVDNRTRIVALIGPPGAGKTTTLVKLAVNHGLASRRPVLLLSMDTYRVAAAEQLRSYAAILGVGFQVVETLSALVQTLEENRGKELILIDTPGLGFKDLDAHTDLARFLSTRGDIDRHLVLSSSMKSADLSRVADSYEIFRPQRLLFTRLDETSSLGPVFSEAVRTEKPLSFFTTGQRIPEDLEPATQDRLMEAILGEESEEALAAA
ncbi:MAG: hypothetical protein JO323_11420 [Acidobacteriia bacterium]|nr:hypothetical protein [Terriglobia bacterium]